MSRSVVGHVITVPVERRMGIGPHDRIAGVWRAEHTAVSARRAWRAWSVGGGRVAMEAEQALADRMRDARMVIAIEGFACARPSDAAAHSATVWLRQHDPRAAQNRRRGMEIQRRRLDNAMVMAGMSADGRGRWAVEQVVGQVKQWVKVRWVGFNPRSGLPWPLEWIRRERLTRDLWEQTRLRRPAVPRVKRPAPEMQQDGAPRRRTPRLAGEAPGAGL